MLGGVVAQVPTSGTQRGPLPFAWLPSPFGLGRSQYPPARISCRKAWEGLSLDNADHGTLHCCVLPFAKTSFGDIRDFRAHSPVQGPSLLLQAFRLAISAPYVHHGVYGYLGNSRVDAVCLLARLRLVKSIAIAFFFSLHRHFRGFCPDEGLVSILFPIRVFPVPATHSTRRGRRQGSRAARAARVPAFHNRVPLRVWGFQDAHNWPRSNRDPTTHSCMAGPITDSRAAVDTSVCRGASCFPFLSRIARVRLRVHAPDHHVAARVWIAVHSP